MLSCSVQGIIVGLRKTKPSGNLSSGNLDTLKRGPDPQKRIDKTTRMPFNALSPQSPTPSLMKLLSTLNLLLAFFLLSALGCKRENVVSIDPNIGAITPDDYDWVYEKWTRHRDDFSFWRMQTVLHVSATFESWEFRRAYLVRYAEDYSLSTERREAMWQSTQDDARQYHRFFVTLAGQDYKESNLIREQSAWRVSFVDEEGVSEAPFEIEYIRKPRRVDALYFPTLSSYRQAFRISFPVEKDGKPLIKPGASFFVLRFASPLGKVDLRWDLKRPVKKESPRKK